MSFKTTPSMTTNYLLRQVRDEFKSHEPHISYEIGGFVLYMADGTYTRVSISGSQEFAGAQNITLVQFSRAVEPGGQRVQSANTFVVHIDEGLEVVKRTLVNLIHISGGKPKTLELETLAGGGDPDFMDHLASIGYRPLYYGISLSAIRDAYLPTVGVQNFRFTKLNDKPTLFINSSDYHGILKKETVKQIHRPQDGLALLDERAYDQAVQECLQEWFYDGHSVLMK